MRKHVAIDVLGLHGSCFLTAALANLGVSLELMR